MKFTFLISILLVTSQFLSAQNIREDIKNNPNLSAHTYLAYPNRDSITYTSAPTDYVPFHIEHYGRHGSRWLTSEKQYSQPVIALLKADKYGYLTNLGKDALRRLQIIQRAASKREGELSLSEQNNIEALLDACSTISPKFSAIAQQLMLAQLS